MPTDMVNERDGKHGQDAAKGATLTNGHTTSGDCGNESQERHHE